MKFSYSQTENFVVENLSSDTGYFKKPVEINRGHLSFWWLQYKWIRNACFNSTQDVGSHLSFLFLPDLTKPLFHQNLLFSIILILGQRFHFLFLVQIRVQIHFELLLKTGLFNQHFGTRGWCIKFVTGLNIIICNRKFNSFSLGNIPHCAWREFNSTHSVASKDHKGPSSIFNFRYVRQVWITGLLGVKELFLY